MNHTIDKRKGEVGKYRHVFMMSPGKSKHQEMFLCPFLCEPRLQGPLLLEGAIYPCRAWGTKHFVRWGHFQRQRLCKTLCNVSQKSKNWRWPHLAWLCGLKNVITESLLSWEGAHAGTLTEESNSEQQSLWVFRCLRRNSQFSWLESSELPLT